MLRKFIYTTPSMFSRKMSSFKKQQYITSFITPELEKQCKSNAIKDGVSVYEMPFSFNILFTCSILESLHYASLSDGAHAMSSILLCAALIRHWRMSSKKNREVAVSLSQKEKEVIFKQSLFNRVIRENLPEVNLDIDGACAGHVSMWHGCYLEGKNYLQELDNILHFIATKQALTSDQLKLLNDMLEMQDSYSFKPEEHNKVYKAYLLGAPWHPSRRTIVEIAIEYAISHPEQLIILGLLETKNKTPVGGHVIGIFSGKDGLIRYFDPNFKQAVFEEAAAAKMSLSRLLAYNYSASNFSHFGGFFKETCLEKVEDALVPYSAPKI